MAITRVNNDLVDLNQTNDITYLRIPVGDDANRPGAIPVDYLVVGGGGGAGTGFNTPSMIGQGGGGGAGGLITSWGNGLTTTNSLNFPTGKTAVATYMLDANADDVSTNYNGQATDINYKEGIYGTAAVFNGSSSKIVTGIDLTSFSSTSLSVWVYWTGGDFSPIFGGQNSISGSTTINRFNTGIAASGGRLDYISKQGDFYRTTDMSLFSSNNWNHIVITDDFTASSTSSKLYVNGQLENSFARIVTGYGGAINTDLYIGQGKTNNSGQAYLTGSLDQVRIYNTELSSTDISNIYNNEVQYNSGGGSLPNQKEYLLENTNYTITVGRGGINSSVGIASSANGENSVFNTITALGGGLGGNYDGLPTGGDGGSGSSGGGGAYANGTGGAGTANQGYAGGDNQVPGTSPWWAGGGGGSGAPGIRGTSTQSPDGGSGTKVLIINSTNAGNGAIGEVSGTDVYYAGGGGGGRGGGGTPKAEGGIGGGAEGGSGNAVTDSGVSFTGGGGGGGGNDGVSNSAVPLASGGRGGDGVVLVRYPTANVTNYTITGTLNEPSGTDWNAYSGGDTSGHFPFASRARYNFDGNFNNPNGGGVTHANTTFINGRFKQGVDYDGTAYSYAPTLMFTTQTDYTASGWFRFMPQSTNSNHRFFLFWINETGTSGYSSGCWVDANGYGYNVRHQTGTSSIQTTTYTLPSSVVDGQWHNICVTYNSSATTLKMYYDGQLVNTNTSMSPGQHANVNTQTHFGGSYRQNGVINTYKCQADQIRYFAGEATATMVTNFYKNDNYVTKFIEGNDTILAFVTGDGTLTFNPSGANTDDDGIRCNTDLSPTGAAGAASSGLEYFYNNEYKTFEID